MPKTIKNKNRIMLDLETMGTSANAAIVAIGAVRFDETQPEPIRAKLYIKVDLESSVNAGMEIDPKTVLWWMQQSDEARSEICSNGETLINALYQFKEWIGRDAELWGNGSDFDNAILASAYRQFGMDTPWKFWNNRCYRTIKSLHPHIKMQRTGVHHCALDDAESQALHLIDILNSQ